MIIDKKKLFLHGHLDWSMILFYNAIANMTYLDSLIQLYKLSIVDKNFLVRRIYRIIKSCVQDCLGHLNEQIHLRELIFLIGVAMVGLLNMEMVLKRN